LDEIGAACSTCGKLDNAYKVLVSETDTKLKKKGKAVSLQACSGPEGSRKLRFPDYMTTAQDGGKVVRGAPAAFTPRKCSWYAFLLEAESTPGP
jgi:hypothetical protein